MELCSTHFSYSNYCDWPRAGFKTNAEAKGETLNFPDAEAKRGMAILTEAKDNDFLIRNHTWFLGSLQNLTLRISIPHSQGCPVNCFIAHWNNDLWKWNIIDNESFKWDWNVSCIVIDKTTSYKRVLNYSGYILISKSNF